jgi:uncharacterized membrane protein
MSEFATPAPTGAKTQEELDSLKTVTHVVYALQAIGLFTGIGFIVAIIINYIKREDAAGTLYESHFDWQIKTFWWGLLWSVVSLVLMLVVIGAFIWIAVFIWGIYRIAKGWLKLNDGKPVFTA